MKVQVCLEELTWPVPRWAVQIANCPVHGGKPYTDGAVFCYTVDVNREDEAFQTALAFHRQLLREDKELNMAKANNQQTMKAWVVSINTIAGTPRVVGLSEEADFNEDEFGSTVLHYGVDAANSAIAEQMALAQYAADTPKTVATPTTTTATKTRQPLRGKEGGVTPGAGSLAIPGATKTTGRKSTGANPIEEALRATFEKSPDILNLYLNNPSLLPAGASPTFLDSFREEAEGDGLKSHFLIHPVDAGRWGKRYKVEVSYLFKGVRKTAKISASVLLTILNNADEAWEFAHQNGLAEMEDEGDEGDDTTALAPPAQTSVHINRIGGRR